LDISEVVENVPAEIEYAAAMKRANQFRSGSVAFAVLISLCWASAAGAQGLSRLLAGGGTPGFCGDGGRAPLSCLLSPTSVALDLLGNRYVADTQNHRVRKITPGNVISTYAGTSSAGFSGDGGPAVRAEFRSPTSVAFDPTTGNVYILDSGNNRIRMVNPAGVVVTVAGDGRTIFAGDGGPATAASISTGGGPAGIFWALSGLYLTDTGNHRVRRISSSFIITTVVGRGTAGFSGDGGQATMASLNQPSGTPALDTVGNLYFADTANHRVRRVTPAGIISTVAGISTGGFTGDGGLATSAALSLPIGVSLDRLGSLYIADSGNHRIRRVLPTGTIQTVVGGGGLLTTDAVLSTEVNLRNPTGVLAAPLALLVADTGNSRMLEVLGAYARPGRVVADPVRLEFQVNAGEELPEPVPLLLYSPELSEFAFGARVSTTSGGNWLSLKPPVGFTPGALGVFVNPARLAVGVYDGTITFVIPQATNSPLTVPVTLKIKNDPPALAVFPDQLNFSAPRGANPPGQVLRIANRGGGILDWTATLVRTAASPLPASAISLSASSGSGSTQVRVSVNSSSLAPGYYQGVISVRASTGETARVPVNLQVTSAAAVLQTSQSGLIFVAVEGSGALPTRNFNVVNGGTGDMSWTVATRSITGGNWLSFSPASGTSTGGQAPPQVVLTANATGLRAGAYHAVLGVTASGAANSPQLVQAVLNVLPPGTIPPPQPSPSGLLFTANAGGASPAAQTVRVFAGGGTAVTFNASITELDDDGWLSVSPTSGTASATAPTEIRVSVDPSGLSSGTYRGLVNVGLSNGSTRSVNVMVVVAPPGTFAASSATLPDDPEAGVGAGFKPAPAAAGADCVPSKLAVVHTGLVGNFASPVGWPIPLVVRVTDDCGASQTNAAVVSTFTNGDPALTMANLKNGQYSATWMPLFSTSPITITSTAVTIGLQQATAQISGTLSANPVPVVYRGGAVQAASFAKGAPLAPGSLFSVFGANLAPGNSQAQTVPLPKELGGLTATLGNFDVPLLYAGSGQFNGQVPAELPANSTAQLVVKLGSAFTVPESINIAAAQPGIFTQNASGTGPGAILDVRFNLVTASNPVPAGDIIQVFGTGFGETNPAVPSGQPAPAAEPLARVTRAVTATVDGISAPVSFAGLAPNFVGLYQVNVQIPSGVRAGEVNLVLIQDGVESNTVTVFVRQ